MLPADGMHSSCTIQQQLTETSALAGVGYLSAEVWSPVNACSAIRTRIEPDVFRRQAQLLLSVSVGR
jgi:hypothetical protein